MYSYKKPVQKDERFSAPKSNLTGKSDTPNSRIETGFVPVHYNTGKPTQLQEISQPLSSSTGNEDVIQMRLIYARETADPHYKWRSSGAFDDKHLGDEPETVQGWVDWRLARWPGFSASLPASTLITGDINAALTNGQYRDYEENDDGFSVIVTCNAVTILPRNKSNPLSVDNFLKANHTEVKLGGYYDDRSDAYVITHLFRGI